MTAQPETIDAAAEIAHATIVVACRCGRTRHVSPRQLLQHLRGRRLGTRWAEVALRLVCHPGQGGCGRRGHAVMRLEVDGAAQRRAAGPKPPLTNPLVWSTASAETRAAWVAAAEFGPPRPPDP